MKHVPASVRETAFSCPQCAAFTTQSWYSLLAEPLDDERRVPLILTPAEVKQAHFEQIQDTDERKRQEDWRI